jgi:ferrous iron transport protein A
MSEVQPLTSLLSLENGHSARIASIEGDTRLIRRMLSLGLRFGTVIDMLNHRGKGVVIQNAGTRVALGSGVAEKLLVEPLEN